MYFIGIVIIPRCSYEEVEQKVGDLLNKYCFDPYRDESSKKPIYTMAYQLCECRGKKAEAYGREKAREQVGTFSSIRKQFKADNPDASPTALMGDERFIRWWQAYREGIQEYREHKAASDSGCPQCNGDEYLYTMVDLRNSIEWFHIGNRWHGVITGKNHFYKQYAAPLMLNHRRLPGCEPETFFSVEGIDEKCDAWEEISANVVDPSEIPSRLVPVVVVTPDGNWHMESQHRTRAEWLERIKGFQKEYGGGKGYWAVACAMKE